MNRYMLDTNICVFFLRGKYELDRKIRFVGFENCCISEISLAELKYGAECSEHVTKNMNLVNDFTTEITVIPIFNALDLFAMEKARLRRAGIMIDNFDLLIGCSSIANNMILVTENEKHLNRISSIQIENWVNRNR